MLVVLVPEVPYCISIMSLSWKQFVQYFDFVYFRQFYTFVPVPVYYCKPNMHFCTSYIKVWNAVVHPKQFHIAYSTNVGNNTISTKSSFRTCIVQIYSKRLFTRKSVILVCWNNLENKSTDIWFIWNCVISDICSIFYIKLFVVFYGVPY